ncbi:MAG: hypothetical protein AB7E55_36000 [Pigmentiphaga sp.]
MSGAIVKRGLRFLGTRGIGKAMKAPKTEPSGALSREERLAAKLRENLHRRKAQARAQANPDENPVIASESDGVSKTPPES